uniref:RRM domain-containing protein n=1 Tax=Mola mola TaxID=94237 RepID=A0A3Q3W3J0_MOLML
MDFCNILEDTNNALNIEISFIYVKNVSGNDPCSTKKVVIRLQGLKITAGSEDIRKFFTGLKIPDGGVNIIGGEREEAFIIFASDEDARRAMTRSGGCIHGTPTTLLLSSKTEMQNVLERSTKHRASNTDELLVFLRGMPFSVTEAEVEEFFSGLRINEIVLLKNGRGANNGNGFVKFATREDAYEALKRDRNYIGARYVEVSTTTAQDWCRAIGRMSMHVNTENNFERERSPLRNQTNPQHFARSQSPLAQRSVAPDDEYCVLLENLSFAADKEHIKNLFCNANLEDDQILHLLDSDRRRTRSTFVLFKSLRDYCEALSHEKRLFLNRWVHTRPISREKMIALLESQSTNDRPGGTERFQDKTLSYLSEDYDSEKVCLFVQNLPFDVRKVEIMDFFVGFTIMEDKVLVLRDHKGAGVGKALIEFQSEAEAMRAVSLDGQRFLGSEVILKCISRSQMQQLGSELPMGQEPLRKEERYSGRGSEASFCSGPTDYSDFRSRHDGNMPVTNTRAQINSGWDYESSAGDFGPPGQRSDGPTCVQLINLPFQIRNEEIYDFCYGYNIIPGSISLQYDQSGKPKGSATAVFESRQEASTAIKELSGRPIGPRKIQLLLT